MLNETVTMTPETLGAHLDFKKLEYRFECGICTASCSMVELSGKDYKTRESLEKTFICMQDYLEYSGMESNGRK